MPLWMRRVGGHRWREALVECEESGEAYKRGKETPGQVTRAEVKGMFRDFNVENNLSFITMQDLWGISVPSDRMYRQYAMYKMHDHPTAGPMGVRKTYEAIARQFYWPGIRTHACAYVESCPRCRAAKLVSLKPAGLVQSLHIQSRRWGQASMDFITKLPMPNK